MNAWDLFHMILFAGAVQGIVMGSNLWRKEAPRLQANRFLAAILFFFAYRLITEVLRSIGIIGFNSWTYHFFLEYNWVYGTLIFLYVKAFIDPDFVFGRKDWVHFIPVAIEFIISNYVKIQNFFWDGTTDSLTWLGNNAYRLWMHTPFQLIVFAGLIIFYSYKAQSLLRDYTASDTKPVQREDVRWVNLLIRLYQIFSFLVIATTVVDYLFFNFAFDPFYKFPVYIGMALLTYWLGMQGFARRDTPFLAAKKTQVVPQVSDQLAHIPSQLNKLMQEESLYKNPNLSLADLAQELDLKPYQLTQVLNRSIQQSFSDYVNGFRVKEAQQMINDPANGHLTLLGIAHESGFNSKASFNRVVKKLTGKSPKELKVVS